MYTATRCKLRLNYHAAFGVKFPGLEVDMFGEEQTDTWKTSVQKFMTETRDAPVFAFT